MAIETKKATKEESKNTEPDSISTSSTLSDKKSSNNIKAI